MLAANRPGTPLLEVDNLHVAYGKAEVVHGVSFTVQRGEFVVLLGRNGAGKSTILHAISGLIPKRAGTVTFAGVNVTRASARDIVRAGMVQVLEGHRVFTSLSVEDNLLIGAYSGAITDRAVLEPIYETFPELAERRHQQASRLSGGQQQILAVGQGMAAKPALLILDEPSGGLAPLVVDRILDVASALCRTGIAVLLVEQLVEKALRHASFGYLLETGRIGGAGSAAELQDSALLRRVYLGGVEVD
ncbi:ABC transporter ATP-binding protein [Aquabacter sp. L1I39]|uniref:ABC transporter ATP-binding protein n=1 Tax=Aquabacter sp. L1I39 TaxID=2820278 RepID=UPI001AD98A4B|nr:ABC transporter ATP-binding protein [Aquabacter sp. L1I39]QTL02220.1 ABC transporter ATP-binding protein [Aquabacter sp. L1I39]